jgi:predicted AAA+ superfamily ATPase
LGISAPAQLETHHYLGNIVENYLIAELYKKRTNEGKRPAFWFWQDHKNNEIDLLIEEGGKIKAVEIKSSHTFNSRLLSGLKQWQNLNGDAQTQSYLVYAGEQRMELEHGRLMPWQFALKEL